MEVTLEKSTILAGGNLNDRPIEVPLTVFDQWSPNYYVNSLFFFSPPTPSNSVLISSLSKTLSHFPTLTARLGQVTNEFSRPCLLVGGEGSGVLLVETIVSSKLDNYLPIKPNPNFELLHVPNEDTRNVFMVQLNRFECGGLVIATSTHHQVADGSSMSNFFLSWSKAVHGEPLVVNPVYGGSWLKPRESPRCEFEHRGFEFLPYPSNNVGLTLSSRNVDPNKITNIILHFSQEFISKLKAEVGQKYSTFVTMTSYLWKKITIARGLEKEDYSTMRIAVDGRRRLDSMVPKEFSGNLGLNACPSTNVKQLTEGGLEEMARIVHEEISKINSSYFQSFIDFGEIHRKEDLVPVYVLEDGNVISPSIEVDSWLGLDFEKNVDFGAKLKGFLPAWIPMEGVVILIPSLDEKGGIDVFVSLVDEHADVLTKIAHTLD
ncbi:hypothetical protein LUZ60_012023 [Juncus effusus]|nr:hypothetical protein LUZ60_012023 [Juncus effusus]